MHNSIFVYFILIFALLLFFGKISYKLNLLDIPNKRKTHSKPTAYTGGLAISICYIFALQIFNIVENNLNLILSISCLITIVGFVDDKFNLNTGGKLSLQIIPIFYLIVLENLRLTQIGDYYYFNLILNSFEIPFTLLCVLFLINAFNYFDGLDGTLSFTSISVLLILYFLASEDNLKLFIIIVLLPIIIFLVFNFSIFNVPKLFLGDSGSLLLGFIISFTLIYFAKEEITHPILLAWSISIFVYEFIAINIFRMFNKKNIFKPGLDHLHHFLFKYTKSIFFTNLILFLINILFFSIGYIFFIQIGPISSLISFVLFFIVFIIIRNKYLVKIK